MIQFESDLTTIEQSNRVLAVGIPENSANFGYLIYPDCEPELSILNGTYSEFKEMVNTESTCKHKGLPDNTQTLPCWSAGRLIEIYCAVTNRMFPMTDGIGLVENIICEIEYKARQQYDFSKLEE
jgi:hypothetical protein